MTNSAIQSMKSIDRFLQEVAATEKQAAEAHTEPGSVGGPTEHPVKDVDDSTEEASEGFRSAENESDVKADQGKPSVENTPEDVAAKKASAKRAVDGKSEDGSINPPGTASEDQLQIGTKKEPTGQDPSVETSSVKAEKEDPSSAGDGQVGHSAHPARTNNSELDGYKYAEMNLDKLAKVASDMGNNLLAALAQSSGTQKRAEESCDSDDESEDEKEAADLAGQAGWELAGLLNGNFDKKAADSLVQHTLEEIIKTASEDAEKVAQFLYSYEGEMSKKAMGEMPQGVDPAAMMGGEPGADPAAMGEDPAAMMGGGEEDMAGMMGGGEEEAAMGGGGDDIAQLAAVLEQLGISPEELEAAMAAQGGMGGEEGGLPPEAGGGLPPEAGGGLPPEEEAMEEPTAGEAPGMEVEASDKSGKKAPAKKPGVKAAAQKGAAEKSTRDYIQEVLERSRR